MTLKEYCKNNGLPYDAYLEKARQGRLEGCTKVGQKWIMSTATTMPKKMNVNGGEKEGISKRKSLHKESLERLEKMKLVAQIQKQEADVELAKQKLGEERAKIIEDTLKNVADAWKDPTLKLKDRLLDLRLSEQDIMDLTKAFQDWAEECMALLKGIK